MKQINVMVDGINVNATHFAQFGLDEAVDKMLADGFVPGGNRDWAEGVYVRCREAVMPPAPAPTKPKKNK